MTSRIPRFAISGTIRSAVSGNKLDPGTILDHSLASNLMFSLDNALVYMQSEKIRYYLTKKSGMRQYLMIKLDVLHLLEKNGKTKYWLYKQLGMSYQNFNKMINNETKSIRYENIETLCLLLHCTPNDLFVITEE